MIRNFTDEVEQLNSTTPNTL